MPTLRVSLAAICTILAVTGITACGSDKSEDSAGSARNSAGSASVTLTTVSAPAAATLQATLNAFVDPAGPTGGKQQLVVDGPRYGSNIDAMTRALAGYGTITFAVSGITVAGDTATAQVVVTSPHGAAPAMPMTWRYLDGSWKLSAASACTVLAMGQAPCRP